MPRPHRVHCAARAHHMRAHELFVGDGTVRFHGLATRVGTPPPKTTVSELAGAARKAIPNRPWRGQEAGSDGLSRVIGARLQSAIPTHGVPTRGPSHRTPNGQCAAKCHLRTGAPCRADCSPPNAMNNVIDRKRAAPRERGRPDGVVSNQPRRPRRTRQSR